MELFTINCPTCRARLKVCEPSAIGQIVNCPKCGGMLQITPPPSWQPAPAHAAPPAPEPAAASAPAAAVAPAVADASVRWSDAVPATGAAALPPAPLGQYVDPLAVNVDIASAAATPALPSAPRVHLPVAKAFLGAWLPWASVPLAGILSAWLVGYCLRVDEPATRPAPAASETAAEAPLTVLAPIAPVVPAGAPQPAPIAAPLESPSRTFAETGSPPPMSAPAPGPATAKPPQPRLVMRPMTPSPLEIEAAARSPVPTLSAAPRARPAAPRMAPPAVAVKPKPAMSSSANVPQVDVAQALDTRIASLELPSVPLLAFVQLAGGLAGAPLTLDTDACRELGLKLDAPLAVHEHDVSLGDLLAHVLAPHGLVAEAVQGQLIVTSTPAHRYQLQQVRYNVGDLNDTPTAVARMIQDLVEPQRWLERGGAGRIDIDGPQLLVSQTPRVQHQVVVLLDKLRLARGKPALGGLDPFEVSLESPDRQLAERLATPVSANFREPAELRSLVHELCQAAGVLVLVDWRSLAEAGCRPQSLVSLVVDKQPLAAALDQLLAPLDLSYRVVAPETIEIASVSALRARPELDVYPAGQLLEAAAAGERPTDVIARWLSSRLPDVAWGGTTGWRLDRQSSMLLVRQDAASQRAIAAAIQSTTGEAGSDNGSRSASPASRAP